MGSERGASLGCIQLPRHQSLFMTVARFFYQGAEELSARLRHRSFDNETEGVRIVCQD
jgi:hypothetical protein